LQGGARERDEGETMLTVTGTIVVIVLHSHLEGIVKNMPLITADNTVLILNE